APAPSAARNRPGSSAAAPPPSTGRRETASRSCQQGVLARERLLAQEAGPVTGRFCYARLALQAGPAAVDEERLAGDVGGPIGGEERDRPGDLVGRSEATHRPAAGDRVHGGAAHP